MERSRDNRRRNMSRPYALAIKNTSTNKHIRIYGIFKGKECVVNISEMGDMKFAYRNREFWYKGYYVETAGENTNAIKNHILNQLKNDKEADQLSLFNPWNLFMGSK